MWWAANASDTLSLRALAAMIFAWLVINGLTETAAAMPLACAAAASAPANVAAAACAAASCISCTPHWRRWGTARHTRDPVDSDHRHETPYVPNKPLTVRMSGCADACANGAYT